MKYASESMEKGLRAMQFCLILVCFGGSWFEKVLEDILTLTHNNTFSILFIAQSEFVTIQYNCINPILLFIRVGLGFEIIKF